MSKIQGRVTVQDGDILGVTADGRGLVLGRVARHRGGWILNGDKSRSWATLDSAVLACARAKVKGVTWKVQGKLVAC